MIVLGIDTSSDAAAVGLVADGTLLCEYTVNNGKNHSVKLLSMVETVLLQCGISFQDIDVYACGIGPGSFTGVRIGVATIKGFAQSWEKSVVSISSLRLLAENIRAFNGLRVSAIYARADELFCAAYDEKGEEVLAPTVMTFDALANFLMGKKCMLVGDGALKYSTSFLEKLGEIVTIPEGKVHIISGGAVAQLGYESALNGKLEPLEQMEPAYLRVSQAEREYAEKHKN